MKIFRLTRVIFREWLSLSDNNERHQEILQWLHSDRLQEKTLKCRIEHEFNQCHPYRIFDYDFILHPEIFSNPDLFTKIFDVTNLDSLVDEGVKFERAGGLQNGRKVFIIAKMPDNFIKRDDIIERFRNAPDVTCLLQVRRKQLWNLSKVLLIERMNA